jgi:hypothetical protein
MEILLHFCYVGNVPSGCGMTGAWSNPCRRVRIEIAFWKLRTYTPTTVRVHPVPIHAPGSGRFGGVSLAELQ